MHYITFNKPHELKNLRLVQDILLHSLKEGQLGANREISAAAELLVKINNLLIEIDSKQD